MKRILSIYFLQQSFNLSDRAVEEILYDLLALRRTGTSWKKRRQFSRPYTVHLFQASNRFLLRQGLLRFRLVAELAALSREGRRLFGRPARSEAALAASLLVGMCMIVVGLPGGLLWLTEWDIASATAAKSGRVVAAQADP